MLFDRANTGNSLSRICCLVLAILMTLAGFSSPSSLPRQFVDSPRDASHVLYLPQRGASPVTANSSGDLHVAKTLVLWNNSLVSGNYLPLSSGLPSALAFDVKKGELFVGSFETYVLSVVNTTTDRVVSQIQTNGAPSDLAYDSARGEIFCSLGDTLDNQNLSVMSDANNSVIDTIDVGGGGPSGLAYDPAKGEVFIARPSSDNVAVLSAATNRIVANVTVGNDPVFLAYDSGKGEIFVSNMNESIPHPNSPSNVSVINDTTDRVVATIAVGDEPTGLAYDSGKGEVFVSNTLSSNVGIINDTTNKMVATVADPYPTDSDTLVYDSSRGEVLLSNDEANQDNVSILNDTTDRITATVNVGDVTGGLAYDKATDEFFVSNQDSDNVSVISDISNAVVDSIPIGIDTQAIAYDSGTREVFVANHDAGTVTVVNTSTDRITQNVSVGTGPDGLAYDSDRGEVFVANSNSNSVSVISDRNNTVIATVAVGMSPRGLVYDSAKGEVFVACFQSDNVTIISASTNSIVGTVTEGQGSYPEGLAYDEGKGEVFVSNEPWFDDNVSVINDTTEKSVASVTVGTDPTGIAYDPQEGELFVANQGSDNVSVVSDATDSVNATIPVGSSPSGATYAPEIGQVIVANLGGTLSLISVSDNKVDSNVSVGCGPIGSVDDSGNGEVYVANECGTVSILTNGSGPLAVAYFTAAPYRVSVGESTFLNVTATGGTSPLRYTYVGLPLGCLSADVDSLTCTPSANGTFTIRVYVNDSAGHSANATVPLWVGSTPGGPTITAFTALPGNIKLGGTTYLNVTASGGEGTLTYTYAGLPTGCTSKDEISLPCTPASSGIFAVRVYVNDSAQDTTNAEASFMVTKGTVPELMGLTLTPSPSVQVQVGKTQPFNTTVSCSVSPCPAGIVYAWTLNTTLGNLSSTSTPSVTFTAGSNAGLANITVVAELNDGTKRAVSDIMITNGAVPAITGLVFSPASPTISAGKSVDISVNATCSLGGCTSGVGCVWSINNTRGSLSSLSGSSNQFRAGSSAGLVTLTVNATYNGKTVTNSTTITITTAPQPPGNSTAPPTFSGLPGYTGYILLIVIAAGVVGVVVAVVVKKKRAEAPPPPTASETDPEPYPDPYPQQFPQGPYHPPPPS